LRNSFSLSCRLASVLDLFLNLFFFPCSSLNLAHKYSTEPNPVRFLIHSTITYCLRASRVVETLASRLSKIRLLVIMYYLLCRNTCTNDSQLSSPVFFSRITRTAFELLALAPFKASSAAAVLLFDIASHA
jgi:hypothetical protein